MSKEGTLTALSLRIDFIYEVGDRLNDVLSGFLQSEAGQTFEWKSGDLPNDFGHVQGIIRTRRSTHQSEKSSILINLKPSGLATIGISEWMLNDVGEWEEETESLEERIDLTLSADDAAAQVLSAMIASGSSFGISLRLFLEDQLSDKPSTSLQPEPKQ